MEFENRSLLPVQTILSMVAWASIAIAVVWPALVRMERHRALRWLMAPQMFRHIGMSLLATGVTASGMPPDFASAVATGDLVTSLLAITAFALLGWVPRIGTAVAALATVVGAADLVRNLIVGMRTGAPDHLGSAWLVVAIIVPGMLVAHVLAVRCFLSDGKTSTDRVRCGSRQ